MKIDTVRPVEFTEIAAGTFCTLDNRLESARKVDRLQVAKIKIVRMQVAKIVFFRKEVLIREGKRDRPSG